MPRSKPPTPAQSAASRRNGTRGGRKPNSNPGSGASTTPRAVFDLSAALKEERQRNFQFLLDMRDGLMPSSTLADRLRAVESLLDRDPETARARGEYDIAVPEGTAPKLFELGELDLSDEKMQPPAGWREEPMVGERVREATGSPAANDEGVRSPTKPPLNGDSHQLP